MLIICPLNLRHAKVSTEAYDVAASMARDGGHDLTALVVAPEMERNLNIHDSESYWLRELQKFLHDNPREGVSFKPVVRKGSTHRQIVKAAREYGADLIVMGSRNPTISDYLLGTTTGHVVAHAPCSVYVVRPKA